MEFRRGIFLLAVKALSEKLLKKHILDLHSGKSMRNYIAVSELTGGKD